MIKAWFLLAVLPVAAVMAQDDAALDEMEATRAEMEAVDGRLDSLARSLQERLNLQGDDITTLTAEIIRITETLEELYSRPEDEVAANQDRIDELKARLSAYEDRLRRSRQDEAAVPAEAPAGSNVDDSPDTAGAAEAGDTVQPEPDPVFEPDPVTEPDPDAEYWGAPEPDAAPASGAVPDANDTETVYEPESDYSGSEFMDRAGLTDTASTDDGVEKITRFRILGNDNLATGLIARTIAVGEGTPFDSLRVRYSCLKLDYLQALYYYRFTVRPDSTTDSMQVTLRVSDKAGFYANPFDFTMNKVREIADGTFGLNYYNIGGRARRLAFATSWDWRNLAARKTAMLSYTVPYQFGVPFLWEWYLFDRKLMRYTGVFEYDDMTMLKYGGGLRWFNRPVIWLAGEAGAEYAQRTFNRLYRTRDRDGDLFTLWGRLAGSTRDRLAPGRIHLSASMKLSYHLYHEMGGIDSVDNFGRLEAAAAAWTEFLPKLTVGTEMRYGVASRDVPVDLLFTAGSERILRGHPAFWRLGSCFAHNTTEFSYAVHPRVKAAVFADIGMVWPLFSDIDPADAVLDAGTGITLDLPYIGPGRVDIAVNPADKTWNIYFGYQDIRLGAWLSPALLN